MAIDRSWEKIFRDHNIDNHNFDNAPFYITANQITLACQDFKSVGEKEPRILCKHDTRESRPRIFKDKDLYLLPVKNGSYAIIRGDGYVDIMKSNGPVKKFASTSKFKLETAQVGNSEMQHLDFAYASGLIQHFSDDDSLVLTIRGRKYTPKFDFIANEQKIQAEGVQTEVDAGFEGSDKVVLIEAKNSTTNTSNIIIRQLYYPYRQWQHATKKPILTFFFEKEKNKNIYTFWEYSFSDPQKYNSITLNRCQKFEIV